MMRLSCAFSLLILSFKDAAASVGDAQLWVRQGIRRDGVPASHTLIVRSYEPETMVLPSGEKATERTTPLCALCFSALSSREAVASVVVLSFGLREEHGGLRYLHPRL